MFYGNKNGCFEGDLGSSSSHVCGEQDQILFKRSWVISSHVSRDQIWIFFHRILKQCLWQQKQVFLGDLRILFVATNQSKTMMFPNHTQVVLTLNEAFAYLWFCKDTLNYHVSRRAVCLSQGYTKVTSCPSHILTLSSMISSLSSSGSQASPCPSLSRSSCPEFGSVGQLSYKPITDQFSEIPSTWNTFSWSDQILLRSLTFWQWYVAFCLQGNLLLGQPSRSESSPHRKPSPANPTAHMHLNNTSDARPRYKQSAYLWQVCVLSLQGLYGSHTCGQSRKNTKWFMIVAGWGWGGGWGWTLLFKERNSCLLVFVGCLQSEAIRLGAFIAGRTGHAVVPRVCVYTPCDTHILHFTLQR